MVEEWKKINEELVYSGFRKTYKTTFSLPNGEKAVFDIRKSGKVVCILAVTKEKKIITVSQFRPGPEKILTEIPAGLMEENETPEKAAERELLEETGYTGKFLFVGTSFESAYSSLIRHDFVALDCEKVKEPSPDEHEFIEVKEMTVQEFREHMKKGQMTNTGSAYICMDYLKLL